MYYFLLSPLCTGIWNTVFHPSLFTKLLNWLLMLVHLGYHHLVIYQICHVYVHVMLSHH